MTGKLAGEAIDFTFTQRGQPTRVTGTIDGDRIEATVVRDGVSAEYVATRR